MSPLGASLALVAMCSTSLWAKSNAVLYSEPEDGVFILRDARLSHLLRDSEKICADYATAEERAEKARRIASAAPSKKTLQREMASYVAAARQLMGECLNADKVARNALRDVLGSKALDRVQKAAPFEDMVYVLLLPEAPAHFEALN